MPTPLPFKAYQGTDPYIFVSYAHRDSSVVYPEIAWLHDLGNRIWYDEGIEIGSEWTEAIAEAIDNCTQFLVFISPWAVNSKHVREEIYHAFKKEKKILCIYLIPTVLPPGLDMRLGPFQAIHIHELSDPDYRAKLLRALTLDSRSAPEAERQVHPPPRPSRKPVADGNTTASPRLPSAPEDAFVYPDIEPQQSNDVSTESSFDDTIGEVNTQRVDPQVIRSAIAEIIGGAVCGCISIIAVGAFLASFLAMLSGDGRVTSDRILHNIDISGAVLAIPCILIVFRIVRSESSYSRDSFKFSFTGAWLTSQAVVGMCQALCLGCLRFTEQKPSWLWLTILAAISSLGVVIYHFWGLREGLREFFERYGDEG